MSDGTRVIPAAKIFSGHDVEAGTEYQDANVKVTAVENSHFHFPAGSPGFGKYKSFSYRFDTADRSVVFTGGTGSSDAVAELAKGADILLAKFSSVDNFKQQSIKSGRWQLMTPAQQEDSIRHQIEEHVTPEEIGKMAARAGVKTVVLTHLPATGNPNDDYQRLVDGVKKQFTGQVLVAKDAMEF
jgi:ribonuclease BN (tRNA processing enzyme)